MQRKKSTKTLFHDIALGDLFLKIVIKNKSSTNKKKKRGLVKTIQNYLFAFSVG